jgi:hypothetical protein
VVFADRVPVVHGVECRNLVYSHGRHLQYPRNLVHHTDAAESVLALSEIEERHDGGLHVLRGVAGDDLLISFSFCGVNLKGILRLFSGVSRCYRSNELCF